MLADRDIWINLSKFEWMSGCGVGRRRHSLWPHAAMSHRHDGSPAVGHLGDGAQPDACQRLRKSKRSVGPGPYPRPRSHPLMRAHHVA